MERLMGTTIILRQKQFFQVKRIFRCYLCGEEGTCPDITEMEG
jgi:hypothetical protein